MKRTLSILIKTLSLSLPLTFTSCGLDETTLFETPYINITNAADNSILVVGSDVDATNTYYINLSSKSIKENVTVDYRITAGEGLTDGVDYKIITTGSSVTFLPGIYQMPIRVRWIPHSLDDTKDNTLTIELVSNDHGYTLGVPGPDGLQKAMTITKKNL